jgi:hypothetical protein
MDGIIPTFSGGGLRRTTRNLELIQESRTPGSDVILKPPSTNQECYPFDRDVR